MRDATPDAPSPLLDYAHVHELLIEANRQAGARGASVASVPGTVRASAAAGRAGAGVGARLFTRVRGGSRRLEVSDRSAAIAAVRALARVELFCDDRSATGESVQVAQAVILGTGWFDMNTAVVQLQWSAGGVLATAHALEGVISQRSVRRALDRLEQAIHPGSF